MSKILFHYPERNYKISAPGEIKTFVFEIFKQEKIKLDRVDYIFCSDKYIIKLNKKFLSHNFYTDVMTFRMGYDVQVSGEVYISMDRVKDNAKKYNVLLHQEVSRVIFHGALHLCGINDIKPAEKKRMKSKEDFYLKRFNIVP